jgi:hypothetical protein
MDDTLMKKLCARLTGTVGNKPADEFYQEFNLISSSFSEYYFNEMKDIFHLPGMEYWPKLLSHGTTEKDRPTPMYMSLVCFLPPAVNSGDQNWVDIAHSKAREMLCSLFSSKEDQQCIDFSLANFPTIAIFMAQISDDKRKKKKKKKNQRKSIFDVKDMSSVHCLAAVNYFADGMHTQVLWLATTVEAPPVDSIHTQWQNTGLATYLLCMLVKQHTGIGDMQKSILSLQASRQRDNLARRFYLKLGFCCYNEFEDNGFSQTSKGFQKAVQENPTLWVSSQTELMSFFQLCRGQLHFSRMKTDLTESNSKSVSTEKTSVHAKFPWPCHSMKLIEEYLDTQPILSSLSGEPLPRTDRPLITTRSPSSLSGTILQEKRQQLTSQSWLSTDEIQFLFAFLLRNRQSNRFVHVLGPAIMHNLALLQEVIPMIDNGTATEQHDNITSTLGVFWITSIQGLISLNTRFYFLCAMKVILIGYPLWW